MLHQWNYQKYSLPIRIPESYIQSELYSRLKVKGITAIPELPIHCPDYGGILTPDLVIAYDDYLIAIIEVKSFLKKKLLSNRMINDIPIEKISSKQLKRYLLYGVPLFYCTDWDGIDLAVTFAEEAIHQFKNQLID